MFGAYREWLLNLHSVYIFWCELIVVYGLLRNKEYSNLGYYPYTYKH